VAVNTDFTIHILVQTVNDAAGESFDKRMKLLNLRYLSVPEVECCVIEGDAKYFKFPQLFIEKDAMCLGFFEIKTNLRHF
jgi:N6-L-threonylcarbamoyladenine synthase